MDGWLAVLSSRTAIADPDKLKRCIDMIHYLFLQPQSWVLHRHEVVTFEDSEFVLRDTRVTFDLSKCENFWRVLEHPGNGQFSDEDGVPIPIGMFSKILPRSAMTVGQDGGLVEILGLRDSIRLTAGALELIGRSYVAGRSGHWNQGMTDSVQVIIEGSAAAANDEIQRIISAPPGSGPAYFLKDSNYFMGWARYCAENFVVMTQISKSEIGRPMVVRFRAYNPYLRLKESPIRLWKPLRWMIDFLLSPTAVVDLAITWWASNYYVEATLPKDVGCQSSRLVMLTRNSSGVETEKLLDSFGPGGSDPDGPERVLMSTPTPAHHFRPTRMVIDIALYRHGLLFGCLVANVFVLTTLLALYLYVGRDSVPFDFDGQSLVAILILAPALVATLAVRPGEHGLVAWAYLWVRISTLSAAFLAVVAAAMIAAKVEGGAFDKTCFLLVIGAFTLVLYILYLIFRFGKTWST